MSEAVRVYLDTCVVSGLAKGDLSSPTIAALLQVLERHKAGCVGLLTSAVTQEEIAQISAEHRTPHQAIYTLLVEIPIVATHHTDSGLTLLGVGGGQRADPLFRSLTAILPDENDARHVYQAVKNSVHYFLTVDERTILRYGQAVEQCCGLKVVNPEQMLQVIEALSP